MMLASEQAKNRSKQKRRVLLILLSLGFIASSEAFAHGGGLNAQGCHNNRKTGEYHCHRAQTAAAPIANQFVVDEPDKQRGTQQLAPETHMRQRQTDAPARPTCHTGPRGGTYTITASGRKNYGGC